MPARIDSTERKLDQKIAKLEEELGVLRKQKLVQAKVRLAAAQAEVERLSSGKGKASSGKVGRPKSGTGSRGPRLTDAQAGEKLAAAVKAAGAEGISAKAAAEEAGVNYIRAGKLIKKLFKVRGAGKWTRYFIK